MLIDEFPVKFNSSGLFTAVGGVSSGGRVQAADIILKYLYLFNPMEYLEDTVGYSLCEMYLRYRTDTDNFSIFSIPN